MHATGEESSRQGLLVAKETSKADASPLTTRKRKLQATDMDLETRRRLWQQQVPHLYDLVVSHSRSPGITAFQWPAGAARWGNMVLQRMVLGTAEALLVAAVRLPWDEPMAEECEAHSCQPQEQEDGIGKSFVRVTQYMKHDGPVKYLACSQQSYLLTATQADGSGDVLLFRAADWQVAVTHECSPDRRFKAAESPSGCCWIGGGNLLSGTVKGAHLWDVEAGSLIKEFSSGEFATTAVAASNNSPDLVIASCSDGCCRVWDARTGGVAFCWQCHQGSGSCVELAAGERVASGGTDGHILLYELRQPSAELCRLSWDGANFGAVTHMQWSRFSGSQLAGAYADGRVLLWDVERNQRLHSQSQISAEPPGVVFVHGGHSGSLPSGVAWSRDCPHLMASADPSGLQFWRPSSKLFL
ncbi:WD-40 repeat-containing protein MSI3 [Durusdinium trenchii]|uniref:WD-40 repeat-containing protein MSI3 n=1 Tax=Durusdinium trenchii TaxID=1381693 RepID=A0ABP0KIA3_9DINO